MLIKYKFLDGEKIEINVSDKIGKRILQIENEIKNNNRRETRRHQSLIEDRADLIADESINIEEKFLKQNDVDKLHKAISKLKPSEQELIHKLYLSKNSMTQAEYAKSHNISYTTLRKRLERLRQKLKSTI